MLGFYKMTSVEELQATALAEEAARKKNADSWTREQEHILKVWAEKAAGHRWLHDRAARHYRHQNNRLSYPSIILSTLAGVGGFGAGEFQYATYIIGSVNICVAIIASFQKFLRCAEKSELHGNMSRQYASFYRNITLELTLDPKDRTPALELCKASRAEYDRLSNISPDVPQKVIDEFKLNFKHVKHKPDVANGMSDIKVFYKKCDTKSQEAFVKLRRLYQWKTSTFSSSSTSPRSEGQEAESTLESQV